MNNPLVSIIMGAYNCENTLESCIQSILSQTYENWEFIICDDCSKDSTGLVLEKYKNKYPNKFIILKNENNLRLAATLNKCLRVAEGEYIARADADDESLPLRLETQVKFLEEHKQYDVVGSSVIIYDEYGNKNLRLISGEAKKETLLTGVPFAHPTIMMRKETYLNLDGYTVSDRTRRGQDLDLWFKFFSKGYRGFNLETPLYMYYQDFNNDNKKSLSYGIDFARTMFYGYKLIGFSYWKYIYLLKPIISAMIPNKFMTKYHLMKLNKCKGAENVK